MERYRFFGAENHWCLAGTAAGGSFVRSQPQAVLPPALIGLTGKIAMESWCGAFSMPRAGVRSSDRAYCTDISWAVAQPGDLVFYPDNSHVGIVCGRDENGSLLVIHCASGANNVVITGTSGFISVARPDYFSDN